MNLQIVIQRNHLDGKDSHVRGIKVYGPDFNSGKEKTASNTYSMIQEQTLR
jgi:hypothetical protein